MASAQRWRACLGLLAACTIFFLMTGVFYGAPLAVVLYVGQHFDDRHSLGWVLILFAAESLSFLFGVSAVMPYHICFGYLFGRRSIALGWAIALTGYTIGCIWPFLLAPWLAPAAFSAIKTIRSTWQQIAPCAASDGLSTRSDALLDGLMLTLRERPFHVTLSLRLNPVPPAGLVSYTLGLTQTVPLLKYVLASSLGSVANILAYVSIGVLLTSLDALHHGGASLTPEGTGLVAASLVASVGLMCWLARVGDARLAEARAASALASSEPGGGGASTKSERGSGLLL